MASDRVLAQGDVVVVDIGGTTSVGYCSDSTRTYALGEPDPSFLADYAVLVEAQAKACESVAPGMTCEEIDAVARNILADAQLDEFFIHRTGHGIGFVIGLCRLLRRRPRLPVGGAGISAMKRGRAHPAKPGLVQRRQRRLWRDGDKPLATPDPPPPWAPSPVPEQPAVAKGGPRYLQV